MTDPLQQLREDVAHVANFDRRQAKRKTSPAVEAMWKRIFGGKERAMRETDKTCRHCGTMSVYLRDDGTLVCMDCGKEQ
jgi:hypothetical protein